MPQVRKHPLGAIRTVEFVQYVRDKRKPVFDFAAKLWGPGMARPKALKVIAERVGNDAKTLTSLQAGMRGLDPQQIEALTQQLETGVRESGDDLVAAAWEKVKPQMSGLAYPTDAERDQFRGKAASKRQDPQDREASEPEEISDGAAPVHLNGQACVVIRLRGGVEVWISRQIVDEGISLSPNGKGGVIFTHAEG